MAGYTVTTLGDVVDANDGVVSPREALTLASGSAGPDTITFAANLTGGTTFGVDDGQLRLTNGSLVIDSDVTISGDAVGNDHVADITIYGSGGSRVFDIIAGTSILDALVITRGFVYSGGSGGGIRIASGADVTIDHSTFSHNYAYSGGGGGITNAGTLTLTNSTIAENRAGGFSSPGNGGGLQNELGGTANLTNVTVYGNSAYGSGGGISNAGTASLTNVTVTGNFVRGASGDGGGISNDGTATLANTIVAGNLGHSAAELQDGATPTTFLGANVIGVGSSDTDASDHVVQTASIGDVFADVTTRFNYAAPLFQAGKLKDNGGPVETVALAQLRTNPAIDGGDDTLAALTDARGEARADAPGVGNDGNNYSDLGAFEVRLAGASLETPSLVVTTADDVVDWTDGVTSLREALTLANSAANGGDALNDGLPDVITFDPTLAGQTLTLTNGQLVITDDVTIDGDVVGDDKADITIDGDSQSRVFDILAGTATLDALVITGGGSGGGKYGGYSGSSDGGGIRIASGAAADIIHTTISGNEARNGAGIWSDGTLTLTSSTIAGNGGKSSGAGGLYVGSHGIATLVNVTVYRNSGGSAGGILNNGTATLTNTTVTGNSGGGSKGGSAGGILNSGSYYGTATLTLTDSIVAGNSSGGKGSADIGGGYYSPPTFHGLNVVGVGGDINSSDHVIQTASLAELFDSVVTVQSSGKGGGELLAGGLADNGGPVETVALARLLGNPAIDVGNDTLAAPTDARGEARVDVPGVGSGGADFSDLGAFEAQVSGPLEAPSLVVTTDEDVIDWSDGVTSLREALALANSGANGGDALNDSLPDVITFDPGLAGHRLTLTNGQLSIASDVTILGDINHDGISDITVDANGVSRVFNVTAGTSALDALVITGGHTTGDGGGVRISNGASLTITNSTIIGNEAGQYARGAGISNNGTLALTNSTVASNDGGGISNGYSTSIATLANVTIYGNHGHGSGGFANNGSATLVNTTVTGNASAAQYYSGYSGGISTFFFGSTTLTNSIVAGNYAKNGNSDLGGYHSPTFLGLNIVGVGGDDADATDHVIKTPTLTDLFAEVATIDPDGPGGIAAFEAGELADNGGAVATVAIKPTSVAHDAGDDAAAAYDEDGNAGTPDVPIETDARGFGFGRFADAHVDIGAFEVHTGQSLLVTTLEDQLDSIDPDATLADFGGADDLSLREALVLAQQDPASHDRITFDADTLTGGSEHGVDDGVLLLTRDELFIYGAVTIDGDLNGDGSPDITIDAQGYSGVLVAFSGNAILNGLVITGGYAFTGGGVSVGYLGFGSADVTISNSTVSYNAAAYGGGISVDPFSRLRLTNSTVEHNGADYVGGGIASQGKLTVLNSTVSDNTSGYVGGGIASQGTLNVLNSTLSNNRIGSALGGYYGPSVGAGLYNYGDAVVVNTTISGNSGAYLGGGVYNSADLALVNATIANNTAVYGGGLYDASCGCGDTTLDNATVSGNFAEIGGGIYHADGMLRLTNSIVAGNGAGYSDPDFVAAGGTTTFSGVNLFSQDGIGRAGLDKHISNLALVFANLATVDPTSADGDEFQAGALAGNGGPVETIAIRFGGEAYNKGSNAALPLDTENLDGDSDTDEKLPFDARGLARVAQGTVDIGAFEIQTPPVNSAPVNTVPATQEVEANSTAAITGLSVADADAGGVSITTVLTVTHGTLTMVSAGGASVSGSGTASVALTGTVAQINTTLAAADNVVYAGAHDFFGPDTLTVLTNDGGNTGTGGPLTDTDSVTINVNTLTIGTPGDDAYEALRGQEMFVGLGGTDTITFNFRLVDARVSYEGNKVIIDGPSTHTVLTGFEVFVFTDGTVHNDDGSPLIDDLFYYSQYHDVWDAHVDADAHYNTFGWHEGRDPDAFFSTAVYLSLNPDVRAAGVNPLVHFDQNGWTEGRLLSIAFDPARYLAANPDVAAAHVDPLRHFFEFGAAEGRQPFALTELLTTNGFDYVYYLTHNPDVAAAGTDPFQHFQSVGWKEGRNPNALFDVNGYLANYPDVAAANINPLDHYNQFGWHEGRDPSPDFDTTAYLAANPDVTAAHVNPLIHFLQFGVHEGRSPFADGIWG